MSLYYCVIPAGVMAAVEKPDGCRLVLDPAGVENPDGCRLLLEPTDALVMVGDPHPATENVSAQCSP